MDHIDRFLSAANAQHEPPALAGLRQDMSGHDEAYDLIAPAARGLARQDAALKIAQAIAKIEGAPPPDPGTRKGAATVLVARWSQAIALRSVKALDDLAVGALRDAVDGRIAAWSAQLVSSALEDMAREVEEEAARLDALAQASRRRAAALKPV